MDEFLDHTVKKGQYRNFDLYSDAYGLLVDEVIKYEDLPDSQSHLGARLGLTHSAQLPVTKNRSRKDHRSASEILNDEQKTFIRQHCRAEFELLGYDDA